MVDGVSKSHITSEVKQSTPVRWPTWIDIKRALLRPSVLSVFLIVGLWNAFVASDFLADKLQGEAAWQQILGEIRMVNVHLQLRF